MRAEGMRCLILGGTADARELAAVLEAQGIPTITALAGVTSAPLMPLGRVRIGGFGGAAGIIAFCKAEAIACIADATHPFAAQISANAHAAAAQLNIRYLRLERPAWQAGPGDQWIDVADTKAAAGALPPGARVLLTVGRKDLAPFLARSDVSGVIRSIEPPAPPPPRWQVLQQRPPFTLDHEFALMRAHGITALVTKNAGGAQTSAKLMAARRLEIPVVMIARPAKPDAETAQNATVLAALITCDTPGNPAGTA